MLFKYEGVGPTKSYFRTLITQDGFNYPVLFRYEGAGLTGSYCRDPDYSGRVWCYTSPEENKFDYCDIKECGELRKNA